MKKSKFLKVMLPALLVLALVAEALVIPSKAVKADETPDYTVSVTTKALKKAKANITVTVNGTKLGKKAFAVKGKVNGQKDTLLYIPFKAFMKAVDGPYTVKGKKITIQADNAKLTFKQGKNAYTYSYTDASGAKNKFTLKLGKSYKKNKQLYIPLDAIAGFAEFECLLFDYTLDENAINITFGPNSADIITGGWGTPESPVVPEIISEYYDKQNELNKEDLQIVPVAVLKQQVVAGMNYKLLFKVSNPSQDVKEVYSIATVYVDLEGNVSDPQNMLMTDIETNIAAIPGGWTQPQDITFPAMYQGVFDQVTGQLDGVSLMPVAYVAYQLVNGYNLCVLCEATVVYPGAEPIYAFLYVYVDPTMQNAEITEIANINDHIAGASDIPEDQPELTRDDYFSISGNYYLVMTPAGLNKVCEMEENPDGTFNTNVAILDNDMVIDFEIATMGEIDIPEGKTLTIEKGGMIEASVYLDYGSKIIVKDGGILATTMGGIDCISNSGEIIIEEGGILMSQKGGTIHNQKNGKIRLDGRMAIGCLRYDNTDNIWFTNEGEVTGKGTAVPYIADQTNDIQIEKCIEELKKMINNDSITVTAGLK